ncbi:MAG: restriction endonuclease subunit S, partial [Dysgonomonas sp.]
YAYLSSKSGNTLITQSKYGAVIQHIEPAHIENIPVPIFSESKQQEIHNLIVESANLRVEANRLLEEAQAILIDNLNYNQLSDKQWKSIPSNTIKNSFTSRFESSYYVNEGQKMASHIKNNCSYKLLKDVTSDIFRPGIFKRIYVNKGVVFLGGSDIMQRIPSSEKQLSISKTKGLDSLMVKEGWILVTCGGTIGNSVYVDGEIAKCAASQHILRLIPKGIPAGYLFAFINSNFGKEIIQRYTYGSVIPQIEPSHIGLIPIPLLSDSLIEYIDKMTIDSITKNEIAKKKELEAISLVEKEIESWQQS